MCTGEVIWGVSAVLACAVFFFFWPLPPFHLLSPFYWHCHRHSMKATDWMRRWVRVRRVRYCLLSVCFFPPPPVCWSAKEEVGFGCQATALCPLLGDHELKPLTCIAWASISPPWFGLLCWPLSYILCTCAVWFMCSPESHKRDVPSVLQSCLQSYNIWCINSCNSPECWDWIDTSV